MMKATFTLDTEKCISLALTFETEVESLSVRMTSRWRGTKWLIPATHPSAFLDFLSPTTWDSQNYTDSIQWGERKLCWSPAHSTLRQDRHIGPHCYDQELLKTKFMLSPLLKSGRSQAHASVSVTALWLILGGTSSRNLLTKRITSYAR